MLKNDKLRMLIYCALFAALTAVFAQLSLPIGPVPISLATFGVMMCGLLLGGRYGALSMLCYILLGLVGVPVFSGLRGGAGALVGATGGYIVGYLPYAILAGMQFFPRDSFGSRCVMLLLGTLACYVLGTGWFMYQSGRALGDSLTLCVLPFLPGDAAKIALAAFLAPRLRKALRSTAV